ncbi:MAG: DUF2231 domain-containing protein [Candidatus Doudnabacteria bacterium]
MNIHPIFVHFPIALLTTYAVLELLRFDFINRQPYWFYVKAVLVILGALSGYVTIVTGLMAESLIKDQSSHTLISTHELWAITSIGIFSIIALVYLWSWWNSRFGMKSKLVLVLALAGILCLLITGALGGSIIFGHTTDPFTNWIYNLFF